MINKKQLKKLNEFELFQKMLLVFRSTRIARNGSGHVLTLQTNIDYNVVGHSNGGTEAALTGTPVIKNIGWYVP